ncbi:MAG: zinc-binding dehydrogenase [Deltaproteobacteria bacterium]|nr:zinc-binding dehydrogenase [Deltaproteobacteria bacterium]
MRAVVIREHGGLEVLAVTETPTPEPAWGQVRVRVRACALNHLDLWIRRGLPGAPWRLPLITGADVSGDVDAVGPGVEDLAPGTPVMVMPGLSCGHCARCVSGADHLCPDYGILGEHADGGLAEYCVVPRRNLVAKPERLDHTEAAALSLTFLTAWHMLVARAELRGGEVVLIQAAGSGVGSAAVQIARHLGATVIATAGSAEKLAAARDLGADFGIDYTSEDFVARTRQLTGGRGADVVFEHIGGDVFEKSLRALAWGGRLVTCGATAGVRAEVNLRHVFFKSQSILGSTMGSKGEYHQLVKLYERGIFQPVIDRVLPLDAIADAHRALEAREVFGKVVMVP